MSSNWKNIWENRAFNNVQLAIDDANSVLEQLLRINGYDSQTGGIKSEAWNTYVEKIIGNYEINRFDSIFDVGCGAGALLFPFFQRGHEVGGLDYSSGMIDVCNAVFKNNNFSVLSASEISETPKYDVVLSSSVIFYFPDYEYAKKVILKMAHKAKRKIILLDVPDLEKKEECERERRGLYSKDEYEKKYAGLEHLYYPKSFFYDLAAEITADKIVIENQNIEGYFSSRYRYNVVISL